MQKHGFRFMALVATAALLCGCSGYNQQQAAHDFFDGTTRTSEMEQQPTTQQQNADPAVRADLLNGVLNVGLQWLVSSEEPAHKN